MYHRTISIEVISMVINELIDSAFVDLQMLEMSYDNRTACYINWLARQVNGQAKSYWTGQKLLDRPEAIGQRL